MTTTSPCPGPECWQDLLAGRLSADDQSEFAAHLETCTACQRLLETMSETDGIPSDAIIQLSPEWTEPEPGLRRALDALKEQWHTVQDVEVTQDDNVLALLDGSNRAESLGRLAHYDVQELIGRGGMGIVFRAFDEKLQRVVAVKVMAPQPAVSETARKRFIR